MADEDVDVGTWEGVAGLEREFELPKGFVQGLLKEDDWSFVIKLHALIEASVAHMLTARLGENLSEFVHGMSLRGRTSKLNLAKALGYLDSGAVSFVGMLADLRNSLAHGVSNLTFSFRAYLTGLDDESLKRWLAAVDPDYDKPIEGEAMTGGEFAWKSPKLAMWAAAARVMTIAKQQSDVERHLAAQRQVALELYRRLPSDDVHILMDYHSIPGLGRR